MIRHKREAWCRYKLIFEPQKTVSAKVELAIEKNTGGRWKFELRLEATQPDVDGSITIQAGPGKSALGELALFSPTDQLEHFTCHFSHDSSISFDVSPAEVKHLHQFGASHRYCSPACFFLACMPACHWCVVLGFCMCRQQLRTNS